MLSPQVLTARCHFSISRIRIQEFERVILSAVSAEKEKELLRKIHFPHFNGVGLCLIICVCVFNKWIVKTGYILMKSTRSRVLESYVILMNNKLNQMFHYIEVAFCICAWLKMSIIFMTQYWLRILRIGTSIFWLHQINAEIFVQLFGEFI